MGNVTEASILPQSSLAPTQEGTIGPQGALAAQGSRAEGRASAAPPAWQDTQEKRFVYDQLRQEILQNETHTLTILALTLAAVAALLKLAMDAWPSNAIACVSSLVIIQIVLLIASIQSLYKENSTFIIASYLRTFVEPGPTDIKWETRLAAFRIRRMGGHTRAPLATSFTIYVCLGLAACLLSIAYMWLPGIRPPASNGPLNREGMYALTGVSGVLFLWLCGRILHRHWTIQRTCKGYDKAWKKVKRAEDRTRCLAKGNPSLPRRHVVPSLAWSRAPGCESPSWQTGTHWRR